MASALVVDPDSGTRDRIRDALLGLEFRVFQAPGPGEALALGALRDEGLDLLVTEVLLPRMSGIDLASRLSLERTGLKVLYVSQQMHRFVGENATHVEGSAFLRKPFSDAQLMTRLRDLAGIP